MSTTENLPDPQIEPVSPALAGGFFTTRATWEAPLYLTLQNFIATLQNSLY